MDRVLDHPSSVSPGPITAARAGAVRACCFAACVAFAAVTMWRFHDRQWNPYDDGTYLHVADRMVHGEVLNRDVQDMHAGYINFVNALALRVFGNDAVSLRYPLVLMGVANAAMAFWLLAGVGTAYAAAGSVATTALSYTQFMNPAAHWYALFLVLAILVVMSRGGTDRPGTQLLLGMLVGLVILFRQLSGVFAAMGVLFYLLVALPRAPREQRPWAARALIALMALGLAGYIVRKTDPVAALMYGMGPLAVLAWGLIAICAGNRRVIRMLSCFAAGGVVAAIPLVAYHVYHGSVRTWLDDTVFGAMSLTRLSFFEQYRYWKTMLNGARAIVHPPHPVRFLTGGFWVIVPALPVLLGALVFHSLWRRRDATVGAVTEASVVISRPPLSPLPVVALFYFGVSLHFQKYMYLFFSLPVVLIGLLCLSAAWSAPWRRAFLATVWTLSVIGFLFLGANFRSLLPGNWPPLVRDHGLPRMGLRLEPFQVEFYRDFRALVDREVAPDESILSVPCAPELYYVSGRRNPTRFYLTAIALHSPHDVQSLVAKLGQSPPKLVFYNPKSSYVTAESDQLMDWVARHYESLDPHGVFEVYRYRGPEDRPPTGPAATRPRPRSQDRDEP
jgi:hypothetical protein